MCFLSHNYKIVSTERGIGENILGSKTPMTEIKKVCKDCAKTKIEHKMGYWELKDFNS